MEEWEDEEDAQPSEAKFFVDGWFVQIKQALAPVDILQALAESDDAAKFIGPRLKGVSHLSQPIPNFDMGEAYLAGEIGVATSIYLSQMIVLATTYGELVLREYYYCCFRKHPQRMNSVLSPDGKGQASVSLKEIIELPSKDEIINSLADRAARRIAAKRIDETVERLLRESGLTPSKPLVRDLKELNERRNFIVHDGKVEDTTIDQVHSAFGLLMYLLYFVCEAAIKNKVPLSDDIGFLEDYRERESASKFASDS